MNKVYNFSAGPAILPQSVLQKAASELVCYRDSGMSVMEMSHRSKIYEDIIETTEALLRDVMAIPKNYKVLFLQGGASSQFAMIPLNLYSDKRKCDAVITGQWSLKFQQEASRYGTVNVVGSSQDKTFSYIPELDKNAFSKDADFFHITTNNTIYGTRFTSLPNTGSIPLVADMSSNILSQVYDVSQFGLIYAGAQKNMGPAGLTVVIVREDLIGRALDITPTMFNYKTHADEGSMYNTPPTYSVYICKLVLEWLRDFGGVAEMEKLNIHKASILYNYLDNSNMFSGTAATRDRSLMNVPFICKTEAQNEQFLSEATKSGFLNLKGHRTVGGMRASIYNAMPESDVIALVDFMKGFESKNK